MVWDVKLQQPVKSHDVVFFKDQFPGLHRSVKSSQDWFSWSVEVARGPASDVTEAQSHSLWHRRLPASIHNPLRHTAANSTDEPAVDVPSVPHTEDVQKKSPEPPTTAPRESESLPPPPDRPQTPTPPPSRDRPQTPTPPPHRTPTPPPPRRGTRHRTKPDRFGFLAEYLAKALLSVRVGSAMAAVSDPQTYKDAISGPDKDKLLAAMKDEMDALIEKACLSLFPFPKENRRLAASGPIVRSLLTHLALRGKRRGWSRRFSCNVLASTTTKPTPPQQDRRQYGYYCNTLAAVSGTAGKWM